MPNLIVEASYFYRTTIYLSLIYITFTPNPLLLPLFSQYHKISNMKYNHSLTILKRIFSQYKNAHKHKKFIA